MFGFNGKVASRQRKKMQRSSPPPQPVEYLNKKIKFGPEIPQANSLQISSEELGLSPLQDKTGEK